MDTNFTFFHGGPGFNALAEAALMTEQFEALNLSISFWAEPGSNSANYSDTEAFSKLLQSAKEFLEKQNKKTVLIAHSFAIHTAQYLASIRPDLISKIIVIAPALNLAKADLKIVNRSVANFNEAGLIDKADQLQHHIDSIGTSKWDNERKKAIELSLEDGLIFPQYWKNKEMIGPYAQHFTSNGIGLDAKALLSVKESMGNGPHSYPVCSVPTLAIFGEHDFIIDAAQETIELKQCFSNVTTTTFSNSAHFPHLEEKELFLKKVCQTF